MENKELEIGTHLFSVPTGRATPFLKRSKKAIDYITSLEGYVGTHPTFNGDYTLWLFDSVEHAKAAKKLMDRKGIGCGNNISEFEVKDDETIKFLGVAEGKDKGKGYEV